MLRIQEGVVDDICNSKGAIIDTSMKQQQESHKQQAIPETHGSVR
jgi:uncharacterized membrane protein